MFNFFRRLFGEKEQDKTDFDWHQKNNELVTLINEGKITEASQLSQNILEYVDKAYKNDSKEKATSYNNMGMIFLLSKEYMLAEECFRDALEMRIRLFGKNHNETAVILLNISHLYKSMAQDIMLANRVEIVENQD